MPIYRTILLMIIAACCGSASLAQSRAEMMTTVEELRRNKQFLDALVLVERVIDQYPDDVDAQLTRAFLNDERGERILAFRNLFELRYQFPDNDTVIGSLGYLYQFSGMLDSALACYETCLRMATSRMDSFGANLNIGSVYQNKQEYPRAIAHYERMQREFPDSLGVLTNLAQSYADNGQKDKAVVIMEKIVERDATYPGAYNNLGLLYTQMGNYTGAATAFRRGIEREPEDAYLLNNYGHLLYKMKEYNKALGYINKSIALNATNPYAYRNRALVYIDMKLMKEACRDLDASDELGFKIYYGDEVDGLKALHCKH